MLHALLEYAEQAGIDAEAGFAPKRVRWLLQFSEEGEYVGLMPASDEKKGREFAKVPHLKFSGDTPMRQFLVDTAQYAVLYGEEDPGEKLLRKHGFFLELLREASDSDPILGRIAETLTDADVLAEIHAALDAATPRVKPSDNVTFVEMTSDGPRILVEQSTWHDWWRQHFPTLFKKKGKKGKTAEEMRCLLSGQLVEPAKTHPKVKGLGDVGGNVETTLVGFNLDAFCSYGLKQSANAAVSTDTAETYAAALNQLIAEHSKRLAGAKVVYWYTHDVPPAADPVATLFNGVDFGEAEVQEEAPTEKDASSVAQANRRAADLLGAIDSGERADLNLGDCRYRALTLGGNAGRAVVRDWMEGSFEQLTVNVKQWFEDLSIVSRHGDGLAPDPKFLAVLGAMVRDLKEVHPPLETALWKSAVAGLPIPHEAMARTLARVRMDAINGESPRHARMGLLKAYLNRKARLEGKENHMTSALNTEPGDMIAYQFGRLIAVLSELQKEALRKTDGSTIKASIADRFYGSASTSPRTVHGQLIKLSQHHLRKLEQGGSRGKSAANAIRNRIAEISDNIHPRSLPTMFDLNEQSEFALGYYHQIAEQNRQRTAKSSKSDEQDTTETK